MERTLRFKLVMQFPSINNIFYAKNAVIFYCVIPNLEPDTASPAVNTATTAVAGLRHVTAPEQKTPSTAPQLPPGQNICADCERLIV